MHWTTNHNASMVHGWIAASIGKVTKFRNQPLLFDTPLVISSTTEFLVEQNEECLYSSVGRACAR